MESERTVGILPIVRSALWGRMVVIRAGEPLHRSCFGSEGRDQHFGTENTVVGVSGCFLGLCKHCVLLLNREHSPRGRFLQIAKAYLMLARDSWQLCSVKDR